MAPGTQGEGERNNGQYVRALPQNVEGDREMLHASCFRPTDDSDLDYRDTVRPGEGIASLPKAGD